MIIADCSFSASDSTPPRVTHQEFIDYNRFIVQFNEPILSYDCENVDNYSLEDMDKHVTEITNRPTIQRVVCSDRQAKVYTRNIRTQYGEFFKLTMRNIRDRNNNIISPNPRTVTLVQRFEDDKPEE